MTPDKSTDSEAGQLRNWLESQPHEKLVQLITDIAAHHRDLRKELMLKVVAGSHDLKALKQSVRKAIGGSRFIDYHQMPAYARRISEIGTMLEQLLAETHAKEAQVLSLYAIERLGNALLEMDDSDGMAGSELDYWQELHLQAWLAAPPQNRDERVALADQLFALEMTANWDEFHNAVQTYADALGEDGVTEYRRLIETEWEKLPELIPGDDRRDFDGHRRKITSMMESVAKASGDVDELIRIKSRHTSTVYDFLQLALICHEAGRHDEALAWAEKGTAAFSKTYDTRLEEFLISEYRRRGEFDRAVARAWDIFERQPSVREWCRLKECAMQIAKWDEWKGWALDHVRDRIARENRYRSKNSYHFKPDASLLVEIFLTEDELQLALQEAEHNGCREALWERMAMSLGEHEPQQAIVCLQRLVEPKIGLTNNDAYAKAVSWIECIGNWMQKAGTPEAFEVWKTDLGHRYKAKRNFIKLMKVRGLLS